MPKEYTCDLCKKQFIQKIDLTRHQNKKSPCITITEMEKIIKDKENTTTQNALSSALKSYLNILRDYEAIVGDKALKNISYLLILKLIEPHIGTTINLENYPFDFSHVVQENLENHKNKLFSIAKFSNLVNEKEENIPTNIRFLWEDILSMHPATDKVFLRNGAFDIKKQVTFKTLINKIHSLDLSNISFDILGHAYEDVIQSIMIGKTLGQFFTPVNIKKMMINLINPQVKADGKIESCCDPAMGTAGFLTSYLQYLMKQAKEKNIQLDWDFIRNEGLYGNEINTDTYQLASANMLISSGHIFNQIYCNDSIRKMITKKFDTILANPPFGVKGLKYDDFDYENKEKYLPFKINNGTILFLQLIIYILKINGRCAVVMPDGETLFSNNKAIVQTREYLMRVCNLHEVIYIPPGTFTNTNIKTAVFYFTKKSECEDILKVDIKTTRTRTIKKISFANSHATQTVKFYNYNPVTDIKTLLGEKSINEISKNSYVLNYTEPENTTADINTNVTVKKLGDICEFIKGKKRNAKEALNNGLYKFITCSILGYSFLNEYDYEETALIINSINGSGKCMIYCTDKYSTTNNNIHFKIINNLVLTRYIYYYLLLNINLLENGFIGANQKKISKDFIKNIEIPIPSLKKQQEIINQIENSNIEKEKFIASYAETIDGLKKLLKSTVQRIIKSGNITVKKLGDICDFLPKSKRAASYGKESGKYPFFTSSMTLKKYVDEPDYIDECLIIGNGGTANINYSVLFSVSNHCIVLKLKDIEKVNINTKFIFNYLANNLEILEKGFVGLGLKNISIDFVKNIEIPIPSLENQQEIIDKVESIGNLIKHLEDEFEICKSNYEKNLKTIFQFDPQEIDEVEYDDSFDFDLAANNDDPPVNEGKQEIPDN